jgi:uncharacterized protein (TIGR02145 family)
MMVDGKYADETKTSTAWSEDWVASNYFPLGTSPATGNNSDKNNARGGTSVKNGGRGICPPGWHVPTNYEWANMLDKVEGNTAYTSQTGKGWCGSVAGAKLKSVPTFTDTDPGDGSWYLSKNYVGTDSTDFSAIPAGWVDMTNALFYERGGRTHLWNSTAADASYAYAYMLGYTGTGVYKYLSPRSNGHTVRCLKD